VYVDGAGCQFIQIEKEKSKQHRHILTEFVGPCVGILVGAGCGGMLCTREEWVI